MDGVDLRLRRRDEFADLAEDRREPFREFLDPDRSTQINGLPRHNTFSRLFRLIEEAALAPAFGRFLEVLGEDGAGVVAVDGKTLRRGNCSNSSA